VLALRRTDVLLAEDDAPRLELAVFHLVMALVFAVTIIGLPIAAQHLKMTRLALIPFGFQVRDMA